MHRRPHHGDHPSFPTRRSSDLKPPWWQTWWAYGIYILLFACVLAAAGITQRKMLVRRERRRTYARELEQARKDRKSTRLNSSHVKISYAVFCLKKKTTYTGQHN